MHRLAAQQRCLWEEEEEDEQHLAVADEELDVDGDEHVDDDAECA